MTYSRVLALVLLCFTASHSYSETYNATTGTVDIGDSGTTGNVIDFSNPSDPYGSSAHQYCGNWDPRLACYGYNGHGRVPTWDGTFLRYGWGADMYTEFTGGLEHALREAGINIDGYNWRFTWKNRDVEQQPWDGIPDPASVTVKFYDPDGNILHDKVYDFTGRYDWTAFTGTELFKDSIKGEDIEVIKVFVHGYDQDQWGGGGYGPEFWTSQREYWGYNSDFYSEITLIYSRDPCVDNPQADPSCPGYVEPYVMSQEQEVPNEITNPQTVTPTQPQTFDDGSGGTVADGSMPGDTQSTGSQEERDQKDDRQQKLDTQSALSSVPVEPTFTPSQQMGMPEPIPGMEQVLAAEQIAISGGMDENQNGVASSQSEMANGMDPFQSQGQSSMDGGQADREDRQERQQRLEELNAASIASSTPTFEEQSSMEMPVFEQQDFSQDFVFDQEIVTQDSYEPTQTQDVFSDPLMELEISAVTPVIETNVQPVFEIIPQQPEPMKQEPKKEKEEKAEQEEDTEPNALAVEVQGFQAYQTGIPGGTYPDVAFYEPKEVPNSRKGLRNGLAQQLLHDRMVEMQYVDSFDDGNYFQR